jgi:hypothetical protein
MVNIGDKLEVMINSYVVPKGTILTVKKPLDAAGIFYTDNPTGKDTCLGFWDISLTSGHLKIVKTHPLLAALNRELAIMGITKEQVKVKICECGKERHGFASHSRWCDLHT